MGDVTGLAFAPGTPVPPQLTITYYGPTTSIVSGSTPASVVLSWPSSAAGFVLQTNGSLSLPNWADYGGAVQSSQGTNSVTITPLTEDLYFRLIQ